MWVVFGIMLSHEFVVPCKLTSEYTTLDSRLINWEIMIMRCKLCAQKYHISVENCGGK